MPLRTLSDAEHLIDEYSAGMSLAVRSSFGGLHYYRP